MFRIERHQEGELQYSVNQYFRHTHSRPGSSPTFSSSTATSSSASASDSDSSIQLDSKGRRFVHRGTKYALSRRVTSRPISLPWLVNFPSLKLNITVNRHTVGGMLGFLPRISDEPTQFLNLCV
jgi:hypothetical protein